MSIKTIFWYLDSVALMHMIFAKKQHKHFIWEDDSSRDIDLTHPLSIHCVRIHWHYWWRKRGYMVTLHTAHMYLYVHAHLHFTQTRNTFGKGNLDRDLEESSFTVQVSSLRNWNWIGVLYLNILAVKLLHWCLRTLRGVLN